MTTAEEAQSAEPCALIAANTHLAGAMIAKGHAPVPVRYMDKVPWNYRTGRPLNDWPSLVVTATDVHAYFGVCPMNIGVKLGVSPSNVVDTDLDCPEAMALADEHLPPTASTGYESKPRSHRWYQTVDEPPRTKQFRDPITNAVLCELRSTGAQSVIAGVHRSGQRIRFYDARPFTRIDSESLVACATELAVASLTRRYPDLPDAVRRQIRRWRGEPEERPARGVTPVPLSRADRVYRGSRYVRSIVATSGQNGGGDTWRAAQALTRGFGLTVAEAMDVMRGWNATNALPPWTEAELLRKVTEAHAKSRLEQDFLLTKDRNQ